MKRKTIAIVTLLFTSFFSLPVSVLAQGNTGLGCGDDSFGIIAKALCSLQGGQGNANANAVIVGGQFNRIISAVVGLMTVIAAIWFIFQFITAGYQWISSGGDKNNLNMARDKITNSLIGLIIVVAAWIVIGLIGTILGLDILNPGKILQNL